MAFITTAPVDERVVLLKPRHVLEDLKESSTDIEAGNIIRLYQQRPKKPLRESISLILWPGFK